MARTYVGDGVADASSAVATARLVVAQVRAGRILVPTAEVTLDESVAALVRATRHQATLVPPNRATAGLRDEALTATDQARTGVVAARDALAETTGARLSAAAGRLAAAAAALDAVGAEATG